MTDGGPWEAPEQAAAYAAFCEAWPLYADTSRALVAAAALGGDQRVADLGCGTGETSRACLARLGSGGRLVGVDPAPRMVAAAQARLGADPRARFVPGTARALPALARSDGPFARVVCNSALWLDGDGRAACRAVRAALASDGAFAVSLPAELVGEVDHLMTPDAVAFATTLGALRLELSAECPPAPPPAPAPAATSLDGWRALLTDGGFTRVDVSRWGRPWSLGEALAWYAQPVVAGGLLPGAGPDLRARLVAGLRDRLAPDLALETRWVLLVARP